VTARRSRTGRARGPAIATAAPPAAPAAVTARDDSRSGDAVSRLARSHIGERYVFGQRVPVVDPTWRGPWDCAEFASWCVFQATGVLYGTEPRNDAIHADAFTGYWGEQARADGATVDVALAARTTGALVLRLPTGDRAGHIVISDGSGGTVEAHSTARGVIASTLDDRRWDFGILVPGVLYLSGERAIEVTPPSADVLRVTKPLMRGPTILRLQEKLAALGLHPGPADGIYGPQTASAVVDFQVTQSLVADGEAGPRTLKALGVKLGGR
jgi:Putative peptidoglycan binding domain